MQLIPDEGAWFAVRHVSPARIPASALPAPFAGGADRALFSAIYALVTVRDFSALHRLRSEETWHFHEGTPLELLLLYPDGQDECLVLGADSLSGQHPQVTVPAGVWMGARLRPDRAPAAVPSGAADLASAGQDDGEAYAFVGCMVAPGFDPADFEPGWRDELVAAYPARAALITALTRSEFARRPVARNWAANGVPASLSVTAASDPNAGAESRFGWVFSVDEVPQIELAPGVTLRELAGRGGPVRSEALSFARFRLEPGRSTGCSRYTAGDEYFVIISGRGIAILGSREWPVGPGAVVVVKREASHSLSASSDGALEFLTILSPAFDPTQ